MYWLRFFVPQTPSIVFGQTQNSILKIQIEFRIHIENDQSIWIHCIQFNFSVCFTAANILPVQQSH